MRGAGAWREGSWRAAEKALLGENDRPVPETPLYTKHLKDWTSFITGQHESCSTHTSNWPHSHFSVSQSLPQNSLLFKLEDRQERGMERDGGSRVKRSMPRAKPVCLRFDRRRRERRLGSRGKDGENKGLREEQGGRQSGRG